MLTLARQQDESLFITTPTGKEIRDLIMNAYHGFAKPSIKFPTDYLILRKELLDTG